MTRCNRHDLRDRDLDQRTVFTDQLNEKQPQKEGENG